MVRFIPRARRRRSGLAIYDDLFPYRVSGFRLTELTSILRHIPSSHVYTTLSSLTWLQLEDNRDQILSDWHAFDADIADRLSVIDGADSLPRAEAFYTLFINNAWDLLPVARRTKTPFVFTLYPGGGLRFNDPEVDEKLREVLGNPLMQRVIVTQPAVLEYVNSHAFTSPDRIEYVFGGVLRNSALAPAIAVRRIDGLHLGFVAHRSDPAGLDKGLDVFIDTVQALRASGTEVPAHLSGPWQTTDLARVTDPDCFVLHGLVSNHELGKALQQIPITIFPTREGVLADGAFDGFPTGAAVEAGLAGSAVLTTNPLGQPTPLVAGRDYMEIEPSVSSVLAAIDYLRQDPDRLTAMRLSGRAAMTRTYGIETQMGPRIACLQDALHRADQ